MSSSYAKGIAISIQLFHHLKLGKFAIKSKIQFVYPSGKTGNIYSSSPSSFGMRTYLSLKLVLQVRFCMQMQLSNEIEFTGLHS